MNIHVPASIKVASGLLASALVGCGGGGGGGGYGAPAMTTPAATASFSQPAAAMTVNVGQAVALMWTSANSTGCTATTSGAGGGTFTGTQSMTGTVSIVPTAPGTYTYTLTCNGTGGNASVTTPAVTVMPSILSALATAGKITQIGSTVDPSNGDQNPYGLAIAPKTAGLITAGDLVVCNFNNGNSGPTPNTQGLGTTLIGLHPAAGATPYQIAQSADLKGCDALAVLPDDSISAAAWSATLNPLVSASGVVGTAFSSDMFGSPWGEAYVPATATQPAALYVSNAPTDNNTTNTAGGTIDRISLDGDAQTAFTEIATGFCSSGSPGMVYGPAGLTYDTTHDTLYVVDTSSASVIAIEGVSNVGKDGVVVAGQCTGTTTPTPVPTFSGPSMASARVIAHGAPFNTPLSAALLKDGDLVVANADIGLTTPSATTNLLIEVSPSVPGGFVGQPLQLDTTTPGALFGLAATVDAQGNQVIYFNDDNAIAVMELSTSAAGTSPTPYGAARQR
jgi:plastocyanin